MSEKDQKIRSLEAELAKLTEENEKHSAEKALLEQKKAELENTVSSLKSMMEWFRKKLFGKMSEKNLPLDPSALEPTLFDEQLSEEEQAALDAEVKAMEAQNARTIEVKAHKREVRKPVYSNLPVIVTDIYPEGMKDTPDYVAIGIENTDRIAIRPAQMYIDRIARHKFVLKSNLQMEDPDRQAFEIAPLPDMIISKGMAYVANRFTPKSRMGKAIVYTYTLLPRLSRYVLDGRYNIDNNGVENAIRPLALGRKNYLFCDNHDAAVRAAIVYSLFACCKAHDVEIRPWLEDTLKRLSTEKDITMLLPENWLR